MRGWEVHTLYWKSKIIQLTSCSRSGLVTVGESESSHESLSFGNEIKKSKRALEGFRSNAWFDPIFFSKSIKYLVISYVCHLSFHLYVISSICRTLFALYRCKSNLKRFLDTINYKIQRTYLIKFSSLLNKGKKPQSSAAFIMVSFLAPDSSLQHYYSCNGF